MISEEDRQQLIAEHKQGICSCPKDGFCCECGTPCTDHDLVADYHWCGYCINKHLDKGAKKEVSMSENQPLYRQVKRKIQDGWETITFDCLREGDVFKLLDEDVDNQIEDGRRTYIAKSDAMPF